MPPAPDPLSVLSRLLDEKAARGDVFTVDEARIDATMRDDLSLRARADRWSWTPRSVRTLTAGGQPTLSASDTVATQQRHKRQRTEAGNTVKRHSSDTTPHTDSPYRDISIPPISPPKQNAGSRFVPPTVEEVRGYAASVSLPDHAEEFVDFFTSNGWKVSGKAAMRDWRAAYRNWCRNAKRFDRPRFSASSSTLDLNAAIPRASIPVVIADYPTLTPADFSASGTDWKGTHLVTLKIERRVELGIYRPNGTA